MEFWSGEGCIPSPDCLLCDTGLGSALAAEGACHAPLRRTGARDEKMRAEALCDSQQLKRIGYRIAAVNRKRLPFGPAGFLLLGITLVTLGACGLPRGGGTPPASAPTSATPSASATVMPTPSVLVSVHPSAQQVGSIAQHNLVLTVDVTVSNHTNQAIWLLGSCEREPIIVSLAPQGAPGPGVQLTGAPNCIIGTSYDLQPGVAADGSHTYTQRLSIFSWADDWQAGAYVLTASLPAWHQKKSGIAGSATGQMTITLH